jgi:hypothetical protein
MSKQPKALKNMQAPELVELAQRSEDDRTRVLEELYRRAELKATMMAARKAGSGYQAGKGVRDPRTIGTAAEAA